MNRCPITYEPCGARRYSARGLHMLSRRLEDLEPLPFTQQEQLREAAARADKMSIQGVQPKLSAVLDTRRRSLELVDRGGFFILKPQVPSYSNVPENEDLTMRLAALAGVEVPFHFLVHSIDPAWTYCIRRFDRTPQGRRIAVEDFAQLTGASRETKYESSMEKVAEVVQSFCTFPMVEKARLFRLTLFNFLVGNEDMHLKNFSLLTFEGKTALAPAYDLVNTTVILPTVREEIALPLRGKKSRLKREDLVDYYALERLRLSPKAVEGMLGRFARALPAWREMIGISFLPEPLKVRYQNLVEERSKILG